MPSDCKWSVDMEVFKIETRNEIFVAENNSQLKPGERFHRILLNLHIAIISLVLKISFFVIDRPILKSHKFATTIFGLEESFLICLYSLSLGHCSQSYYCYFCFRWCVSVYFFNWHLSATSKIISNAMSCLKGVP